MLSYRQKKIVAEIINMFPESKDNGITRQQLIEYSEKTGNPLPQFLTKTQISRGVYKVPHEEIQTNIVVETQQNYDNSNTVDSVIPMKKPQIVYTESQSDFIPEVDPNYVPFGVYSDLEQIIKSQEFISVYLNGHSGCGKNVMVEQICAKHKRPMIRVNMNRHLTEDDLIGSKTLKDGNIEITEGPILYAMRHGCIIVLDELDVLGPESFVLQSILEGKPYFFRLKNEMIHPKKGFQIIAIGNTLGKGDDSGKYIGTNIMNEAFLERFAITFIQDYPDRKIETNIVKKALNSHGIDNDDFVNGLVKWSEAIRKTYEAGGIDEIITTRRLIHIVRIFSIYNDPKKAIQYGVNRFDEMTRNAFVDLFDKIYGEPEEKEELDTEAFDELRSNYGI